MNDKIHLYKPDQHFSKTKPPLAKGIITHTNASSDIFQNDLLQDGIENIARFYSITDMNTILFAKVKWISLDTEESSLDGLDYFSFLKYEYKC